MWRPKNNQQTSNPYRWHRAIPEFYPLVKPSPWNKQSIKPQKCSAACNKAHILHPEEIAVNKLLCPPQTTRLGKQTIKTDDVPSIQSPTETAKLNSWQNSNEMARSIARKPLNDAAIQRSCNRHPGRTKITASLKP